VQNIPPNSIWLRKQ